MKRPCIVLNFEVYNWEPIGQIITYNIISYNIYPDWLIVENIQNFWKNVSILYMES